MLDRTSRRHLHRWGIDSDASVVQGHPDLRSGESYVGHIAKGTADEDSEL
jgi:hypothetical protein